MRSVNAYQAHAMTLNTAPRPAQSPRLNILDTPHRTSSPDVAPRRETCPREATLSKLMTMSPRRALSPISGRPFEWLL